MHHILCVVVISEEMRKVVKKEKGGKKFSDLQNVEVSSWLTQNDENDCDCSGYEGRFPTMVKV